MKRADWEEVANYRAMVDAATDSVLQLWGRSMRSGGRSTGSGYPPSSAGFDMFRSITEFEDLEEPVEKSIAGAATVLIYGHRGVGGLEIWHRRPLVAIYVGGATIDSDEPEVAFLEAVAAFERKARGRGLL